MWAEKVLEQKKAESDAVNDTNSTPRTNNKSYVESY